MIRFLPYLISILSTAAYALGLWGVFTLSAPEGFALGDPSTWGWPTAFGVALVTVIVATGAAVAFNGSADWFIMSLEVDHTHLDREGKEVLMERTQTCLPNRPGVDYLTCLVTVSPGRINHNDRDWTAEQLCSVKRRVHIEQDSYRDNSGNGREFVFRTPQGRTFPFPLWMVFLVREWRRHFYELKIKGKVRLIDAFTEREEYHQLRFARYTRRCIMRIYFPEATVVECRAHRGQIDADLRSIDCIPIENGKPGFIGYQASARHLKPGERLRISWEFPEGEQVPRGD